MRGCPNFSWGNLPGRPGTCRPPRAGEGWGAGMKRIIFGAAAVALAAGVGTVAVPAATASTSAPGAVAASQAVGQVDGGVSSAALSTWQTDGIVFALAYGQWGGVCGRHVHAMPCRRATPSGSTTGEVARTFLAAFNSIDGRADHLVQPDDYLFRDERAPGGVRAGGVARWQHAVCRRGLRPRQRHGPEQRGRV